MKWGNDTELFALMRRHLFSAIIGDVLDLHGLHHQFLTPECKPLDPHQVLVGRAMTVLETDIDVPSDPPFGLMLKALDSLRPNEVYVAPGCSPRYALWGELMTTAAKVRGAVGAVLAGLARDTKGILALDFPVFCYGSYAQDQRGCGRVADYRAKLDIGGVMVQPGDILFGDIDGVVVLPKELEALIVTKALEQARKENTARQLLMNGATAEKVFSDTGVL